MDETEFVDKLREAFPSSEVTVGAKGRIWVATGPETLIPAVKLLRERFGLTHLAVIVGEDMRDAFLLNYVFGTGPLVTLKVRIKRDVPEVPSLASVIPGALVYERELHDLFGIVPAGHPDLRRQAVPEDWPEGIYPMRKDVQFTREGQVTRSEAK